ncbi:MULTISPECIES: carbon storage regulator [unclassified Pseudomonas]|uniref:carbon storage regulator n=1 Tax=unclassified Pseudomonas TaxID=196821 RepID=UPI0009F46F86|nr:MULTISPECIES: carbon storage regulator [unclassified Pseudomonas]WPN52040.1 carbon storage regulator [Pseudomonas sp. P9_2]
MLPLLLITRRTGERLRIDDEIQIKVIDVIDSHVSLGIQAPKHISIARSELHERAIDAEDKDKRPGSPSAPESPLPKNRS